jgi:NAD(P)H-dependent FMN reductase
VDPYEPDEIRLRLETSIQDVAMSAKPRIAIIVGSTRPTRYADAPTQWMLKQAQARDDLEVEVVDLRDHPLPFFDEIASNLWMPSQNPEAVRWQQTIGRFDGFIFVVAEYNHSITGVLKNALDQAYKEWVRKPFTAIAYGGAGGARAVEHLRTIGVELQMVSTKGAVHIGGGDFMAVHSAFGNQPIETIEAHLLPSAKAALDELAWWARATMAARAAEPHIAAA